MLNTVWNYEFAGDSRIVDVHISHLRDKLEDNPKKPQLIKTVRGLGYKWKDLKNNDEVSPPLNVIDKQYINYQFCYIRHYYSRFHHICFIRKHEQALATDARSYIYLVQDNEIDKVKEIVKQQNIDLLITKMIKGV